MECLLCNQKREKSFDRMGRHGVKISAHGMANGAKRYETIATSGYEQDKHPGEFGQTMQCISLSTMVECIAISASAALMHELTFDPFPNPRHDAYLLIQRPHRDVMAHGEAIALVTRSRSYYGRSQPNRILLRPLVRVPHTLALLMWPLLYMYMYDSYTGTSRVHVQYM